MDMSRSAKSKSSEIPKSRSRRKVELTRYTGTLAEPLQIPSLLADEAEWEKLRETLER
jgi:hypothetical protein